MWSTDSTQNKRYITDKSTAIIGIRRVLDPRIKRVKNLVYLLVRWISDYLTTQPSDHLMYNLIMIDAVSLTAA